MLLVREGKRGTVGVVKSEQLSNVLAAQQVLAKMVMLQRKRGYVDAPEGQELLVTEERFAEISAKRAEKKLAGAVRNPDLETKLMADPSSLENFLVYADWLQTKNDPRGEWIAVQCAREKKSTPELERREKEIVVAHGDLLLGPLAAFGTKEGSETALEMSWKRGFIRRASIGFDPDEEHHDPEKTLRAFFALPAAILLEKLEIGPMPVDDEFVMQFQEAIDVLVKGPNPPHLDGLYIGHRGRWDVSQTNVGRVAKLWKAMPDLRELGLEGGAAELGIIVAPKLQSFAFRCAITPENVTSISTAKWPLLERLEVWFGSPHYGATYSVTDMMTVAESAPPTVKHLKLMNSLFTDELIPLLVKWKGLAGLETLDLSLGCLSDAGAEVLAKNAKAFSHLKVLNLSRSCLTDKGVARVKKVCKEVRVDDQEPGRNEGGLEDRYVAVSE